MKKYLNQSSFLLIVILTILFSCSPQSKEIYLEDYQAFILDVRDNSENYSEEDWLKIDENFVKFSKEWHDKFEDDFTWKENLLLSKYQIEYNVLKYKNEFSSLKDLFKNEDLDKLKEQIKYYAENEMDEDIEFIKDQAKEIGQEATKIVEDIMKDLELEKQ